MTKTTSQLQIEFLADKAEFLVAWRKLEADCPSTPFLHLDWLVCWLEAFEGGSAPLLMRVRDGQRMIALAVLSRRRAPMLRGLASADTVWWREAGAAAGDILTPEGAPMLVRPQDLKAAAGALVRHLSEKNFGADQIVIRYVPPDFADALAEIDNPGWRFSRRSQPTFAVDLSEIEAEGFAWLSANSRSKLRKGAALLEESLGELTLDSAQSVTEALAWFRDLGAESRRYWRDKGKKSAFESDQFVAFHENLIERGFAANLTQLVCLRAGDAVVARLYLLAHRDTVCAYQTSFAPPADNRIRPGLLGHAMAIEKFKARGYRWYDLLAGEAQYKRTLSTTIVEFSDVRLRRTTGAAKLEDALRGASAISKRILFSMRR